MQSEGHLHQRATQLRVMIMAAIVECNDILDSRGKRSQS